METVLGLSMTSASVGWVLLDGVRRYPALPGRLRPIALSCMAALAGVLVAAAFDKHFFDLRYQHISALFWMLVAIVVLSTRAEPADNPG